MSEHKKDVWNVILVTVFLFAFAIGCILKPADAVSLSERRKLAQFPDISVKNIVSGKFAKGFEKYAVDQFPLRDKFLHINTSMNRKLFGRKDIDGSYVEKDAVYAMEYPMHTDSIDHAADIFHKITDAYVDEESHVYASVIPDKAKYLGEDVLKMDYDAFGKEVQKALADMQYIDIYNTLTKEDYYRTDPHWRQEKIVSTAQKLAKAMGVEISESYEQKEAPKLFYGSYAPRVPDLPGEKMYYLTNKILEECEVYDGQNGRMMEMYDLSAAGGRDPYELYLGGPLSLVTIRNKEIHNGRKLVMFRDSFGSSIAPLLATGYEETTLVDIRYLPSAMLGNKVDLTDCDVLFLYSTSVLNHSETLK